MKIIVLLIALILPSLSIAQDVVKPAKISKEEVLGSIFESPSVVETHEDDTTEFDVSSMVSSDKKFVVGMFKATAGRYEYNEAYGVDEFMYFITGNVKLTSSDGSVQIIGPGEGVTIPKEWTGVWDSEGYSKIYVIYK